MKWQPSPTVGWDGPTAQFPPDIPFSPDLLSSSLSTFIFLQVRGLQSQGTESEVGEKTGKAHLYRRMPTQRRRRVATPIVTMDMCRDPHWMIKPGCGAAGYLPGLKESHCRLFINYQVKEVPSWWRKLADITLTKWSTLRWPIMGHSDPHGNLWGTHWEGPNITCVVFLQKCLILI